MRRVLLSFLCLAFCNAISQDTGLIFIQNKNQWNEGIDFLAKTGGVNIFVSAQGFGIHVYESEKSRELHQKNPNRYDESGGLYHESIQNHFFKISWLGSNVNARPVGQQKANGYFNYFIGTDPCRWASDVAGYAEIIYPEVYSGIDLRVSSLGINLKYDFIVKAGADPSQIKIEYCGLDGIESIHDDLTLKTSLGDLTEKKPISYQKTGDEKKWVTSNFELHQNVASIVLPDGYDLCEDLVIDPLLIFSTYSGSTADSWGSTATPGEHGALYSSGVVNHQFGGTFPATTGAFQTNYGGNYDVSIMKYDSTGSKFLYATYLGGSSNETPHSLLMDKNSEDLIVLGTTSSSNFPTSSNAFDRTFNLGQPVSTHVIPYDFGTDIFITRLEKSGSLLKASTYLGGNMNDGLNDADGPLTANYGDEMRGDLITDEKGNVFISSVTSSSNFPVTTGFGNQYNGGTTDAVVMKLKSDLSGIIWSGFIGGSLHDASYSIKFDKQENVLVAGGTTSPNFPITSGSYQTVFGGTADGWIARINGNGSSIKHSTFTGTVKYDQVYFIDLNETGEVYCYGQTSGKMPVTPGVYNNPNSGQFLQKFSSDLSALRLSTVFGSGIGVPNISPTAFLVNECDNIFMTGWGGETNRREGFWNSSTFGMPLSADAFQKNTSGSDFYFLVLNSSAKELLYATYLGGYASKTHVDGGTSRFDKFGIVYHAVCAGCWAFNALDHSTSDFPTTPGVKSNANNSINCNNAAFKFDLASLRAKFKTNSVSFNNPGLTNVCFPDSIRFQNISIGGELFTWDLGDGTIITQAKTDTTSIVHRYQQEGTYTVKLNASDINTCKGVDSVTKVIKYFINEINVIDDADICEGDALTLRTSGGSKFIWKSSDNSFHSAEASPAVKPAKTTSYHVTITDADGCIKEDTVNVSVVASVDFKWETNFMSDCVSRPSIEVRNLTEQEADVKFWFDFGDGQTSDAQEATHVFEKDSTYTIKLKGQRDFCVFETSKSFPFYLIFVPNVITPTASEGFNHKFFISLKDKLTSPADVGQIVSVTIADRWGRVVYESNDYKNDWVAKDLEGGVYYTTITWGKFSTCKGWLYVVK